MNIFNFKKDIEQIKKTGKDIKKAGKEIEEKAPLVTSTSRSIFIILKWMVFLGIIFIIAMSIYYFIHNYYEEKAKEEKARVDVEEVRKKEMRITVCKEECNYFQEACPRKLILPGEVIIYPEGCTPGGKKCYDNCLETMMPELPTLLQLPTK